MNWKYRQRQHFNYHQFLMKFNIFGFRASVDIKPLPGAFVAELLGVVLGVQDRIKGRISHQKYLHNNETFSYFYGPGPLKLHLGAWRPMRPNNKCIKIDDS